MRFAGQALTSPQPIQDTVVPGFDPQQLAPTPELPPATLQNEADQMRYILTSPEGGGIAMNLVNPAFVVGNQVRKDIMDRGVQSGTLEDAYLKGVPGVPKPITPDTVRPSIDTNFYTL